MSSPPVLAPEGHPGGVEIRREAQMPTAILMDTYQPPLEVIEPSEIGDILESLPTPRSASPAQRTRRTNVSNARRKSYYDFVPQLSMQSSESLSESLKSARKAGNADLELQLAQCMMHTALQKPNTDADKMKLFKESLHTLKRLSERGVADAQYLLGDIYAAPVAGRPDLEKSFKLFLMAAKHGHAEAAYRAALCLQEGWGTPRDAGRALQFYRTAAVGNQPGALYRLGIAYFYGRLGLQNTSANKQAGVKWLTLAVNVCDRVYNRAPHALASIFEIGYKDLVIPDVQYAAKLYALSAELGYVPAATRLGAAYERGELSCPQDAALSIHYYTIGALGNDSTAQLAMCAWYMAGAGPTFPVDRNEAFEWALRAAENGLPKAQYTVGYFLENGIGHPRDIVEANKWFHQAALNGYQKAKERLGGAYDKRAKCIIS